MAYGDGLWVSDPSLTPVEVEAGPSDILTLRFPFKVSVQAYGLLVTEDFTSQATSAVFSLDFSDKDTSRTEILTLTIDENLERGDGKRASQTAIADESAILVGDVIIATGAELPKVLAAGSTLIIEHKTSAGGAGGAVVPMVLIRVEGYELELTRTLTAAIARVNNPPTKYVV